MQELDQLRALADPERAARLAARHKSGRETLGVTPAQLEPLVAEWRAARDIGGRVALARTLWDSNIHEARLAAARLLVQARMNPDAEAWQTLVDWAPQLDGADIGDAVMSAVARRLVADPARLDQIADWAGSPNPWQRRSLLVATLPWAKMNNPKPGDLEVRERVLAWAMELSGDSHGAVRQAVQTWLHDLGKRDTARVAAWHHDLAARAAARQDDPEIEPEDPSDHDR